MLTHETERWLSVEEIAGHLGISKETIYRWVEREKIPAHRVLNRNGLLTGRHHFTPPSDMQSRLEKEGIKVVHDQVVDFETVFWDPALEL